MATVPVTLAPVRRSRYEASLLRHLATMSEVPEAYRELSPEEVETRTAAVLERLGDEVLILAHNYQNHDVYRWADHTGDSFKLSRQAAESKAPNIVFCGVSFMAETADLLTRGERNVILPSMEASCPMAGMAEMVQVADAWEAIVEARGSADGLVPVTYMNSYADLKAFTGEHGGVICTSSNAERAMRWAFEQGEAVVFFPDKHLGYNTARDLGIPDEAIARWNAWSREPADKEALADARVILWEGWCQVHERFDLTHVEAMRAAHPDVLILTHPECRREVLLASDFVGSTSQIQAFVDDQPAGATLAIGTEIHMVERLQHENPDKTILQLCGELCLDCNAMRQIQPSYLLWTLEELEEGRVKNRINVDDRDRAGALLALERMLAL